MQTTVKGQASKLNRLPFIEDQRGVYLLILSVAIIAIFAVIGLGYDSGQIYLSQMRQQRAADAAATAASWQIGILDKDQLEQLAFQVARDNFDRMGIAYDTSNPQNHFHTEYFPEKKEIKVDTNANVETFIMGKVIEAQSIWNVGASATGSRTPLAVTLVVDVTLSMMCSATGPCCPPSDPDCTWSLCFQYPPESPASLRCAGDSRLDALKTAAKNFVQSFDNIADRFSLISYADEANVLWSLQDEFNAEGIFAKIDAMVADGSTSIHAGVLAAIQENRQYADTAGDDKLRKIVVFITDGAPTADESEEGEGSPYPLGCPSGDDRDKIVYPIIESDIGRADGITFYTIGVGELDPIIDEAWQTVPTQNASIDDNGNAVGPVPGGLLIHKFMLRRMANDWTGARSDSSNLGGEDPSFPAACFPGYSEIAGDPAGEYLESPNASDLNLLLNRVAKSIKARLVN